MIKTTARQKTEPAPEQITLPIEEATVEERQVTIRVLTVNTRQITQMLYRQLVQEQVIDDVTGLLRGNVWGWVNLHEKECQNVRHLHVIWESGSQLKGSLALAECTTLHFAEVRRQLQCLSDAYVCLAALAGKKFPGQNAEKIHLTIKGRHVVVDVSYHVMRLWGYYGAPDVETLEDIRAKSLRELLGNVYYRDGFDPNQYATYPHDQVYAEMERTASELTELEQNWAKSYKTIEQVGQLFVAVSGVWK